MSIILWRSSSLNRSRKIDEFYYLLELEVEVLIDDNSVRVGKILCQGRDERGENIRDMRKEAAKCEGK